MIFVSFQLCLGELALDNFMIQLIARSCHRFKVDHHLVEGTGELADFILASDIELLVELPLANTIKNRHSLIQRPDNAAGDIIAYQQRQDDNDRRHPSNPFDHMCQGTGHALLNLGIVIVVSGDHNDPVPGLEVGNRCTLAPRPGLTRVLPGIFIIQGGYHLVGLIAAKARSLVDNRPKRL